MEGFGFPLLVFIAWIVFSVVRTAAKAAGQLPRQPGPDGRPLPKSLPGMNPDFLEMLRELERATAGRQKAPASAPGTQPRRLPPPVLDDEAEFADEARSLEGEVTRAERVEVSLDSAAEEAIRRRRESAARRDRPRTAADHAAFDARIRVEPVQASSDPTNEATARLRHALIWNEILGRPVALRHEPDITSR